jgi:type VI secretion system protein ImpA
MFDYDLLMQPLAGATPCGPDLRGEPDFRDIEDAPGDFANQKTPELRQVLAACHAFLERTKDQMPAIVAIQAAVRIGDFGLANAALALIKGFTEEYWEDFHPGPASEMAVGRINELTALARPAAMTLPLQRAPMAALPPPSMLSFTAAMVAQACQPTPEWSSSDESVIMAQVESGQLSAALARSVRPNREGGRSLRMLMRSLSEAVRAADTEAKVGGDDSGMDAETTRKVALQLRGQVETSRDALSVMSDTIYAINELYESKTGDSASLGPVLTLIKNIVGDATRFLAMFPAEEGGAAAVEDGADGQGAEGAAVAGGPRAVVQGFTAGVPQSRDDVTAAIDAICKYYADREPTSPVPLILKRVRGWVKKDFMQLISEIAPQGLDEVTKLLASQAE